MIILVTNPAQKRGAQLRSGVHSLLLLFSLVFSSYGHALTPNVPRTYVCLPGREYSTTSLNLLVLGR